MLEHNHQCDDCPADAKHCFCERDLEGIKQAAYEERFEDGKKDVEIKQ